MRGMSQEILKISILDMSFKINHLSLQLHIPGVNFVEYLDSFSSFKEPYVNQSAISIQQKFSLHRTYIIFRTLGLRHLTVVNINNQVVGIITRKDLMGFSMEEHLSDILHRRMTGDAVEMTDPNMHIRA